MNKRIFAGLAAVSVVVMSLSVSCGKTGIENNDQQDASHKRNDEADLSALEGEENAAASDEKSETDADMTITWLADYDLNPQENNDRFVALAVFEDYYGGKINYVYASPDEKFDKLDSMIISGEEVDMFPYEWNAVPEGVVKNRFEALDPYFDTMEIDSDLWKDMSSVIGMFEYKDKHYVVPYSISSPFVITYSRKIMKSEGLGDPYELYKKGEWNWDSFMEMMEKFVAKTPDGYTRYGINGEFGKALIQSSGHTVVNCENGLLSNNINDPAIEKAELLMQEIAQKKLYDTTWNDHFPENHSTLFFASPDWTLGTSNAKNEDMDLMVVPFPKSSDSIEYNLCCNYEAKMLVKNSKKGEAVATYIKCERLAQTEEKYAEAAKQESLIADKTASGTMRSFLTEEQYDAIMSYCDPTNIRPALDLAYGMGSVMYGSGSYTYETKGVMDKLETALLEGNAAVDSWEALRDSLSGIISAEVEKLNK